MPLVCMETKTDVSQTPLVYIVTLSLLCHDVTKFLLSQLILVTKGRYSVRKI